MNNDLTVLLDPSAGVPLQHRDDKLIYGDSIYPIVDGIPRFVPLSFQMFWLCWFLVLLGCRFLVQGALHFRFAKAGFL